MSNYELTVTVTYTYQVEADSYEEAHEQGHDYEDYLYTADLMKIHVAELEDDEEDEETE
jgi:hypothetical protein